jgi:hypothetical protein
MVLFDRSWYTRAGVERVIGFCTPAEYQWFMEQVPRVERLLVQDGIHLIKLWLSVSQAEQRTRFIIRQIDPVRQWKLSPTELASLERWDDYTRAKEAIFQYTDTDQAPWVVVKSNDKKRGRVEAMRHVLDRFDTTTRTRTPSAPPTPASLARQTRSMTRTGWPISHRPAHRSSPAALVPGARIDPRRGPHRRGGPVPSCCSRPTASGFREASLANSASAGEDPLSLEDRRADHRSHGRDVTMMEIGIPPSLQQPCSRLMG